MPSLLRRVRPRCRRTGRRSSPTPAPIQAQAREPREPVGDIATRLRPTSQNRAFGIKEAPEPAVVDDGEETSPERRQPSPPP